MRIKALCASLIICLVLATTAFSAQVTLAWDANTPTPDGYRVFMRRAGEPYDYTKPAWPVDGGGHTETTCTLDGLEGGITYYFVVRAYVGADESGDSNEVTYTPSDVPAIPAPIIVNISLTNQSGETP